MEHIYVTDEMRRRVLDYVAEGLQEDRRRKARLRRIMPAAVAAALCAVLIAAPWQRFWQAGHDTEGAPPALSQEYDLTPSEEDTTLASAGPGPKAAGAPEVFRALGEAVAETAERLRS